MTGKASKNQMKPFLIALAIGATLGFTDQYARSHFEEKTSLGNRTLAGGLSKADLASILGKRFISGAPVPTAEKVKIADSELDVQYSIDATIQHAVEQALKKGRVPYGAFVAMDAKTGQVLAMVSHGLKGENMNLRSSFPAASIFKVITAAAALENGKLQHDSMIPVRGSYHTLYKRNVLSAGGIDPQSRPRFARLISFEEALAKSVNSVFGKVGIFGVGSQALKNIAERFFFNKSIPFEMPVTESQAQIPTNGDNFELAESASGYTRRNTLSPVHGAMIAAAIANNGVAMEPSVVSKVAATKDGAVRYQFEPKQIGKVIDKETAEQLAIMMHKTVVDGTSRHAFRGLSRSLALSDVYIGGKTGTLNGWDPAGRYDWFIGFGENENAKIAVAALCVHSSRKLGIKASAVARAALEAYFQRTLADSPTSKKQKI